MAENGGTVGRGETLGPSAKERVASRVDDDDEDSGGASRVQLLRRLDTT